MDVESYTVNWVRITGRCGDNMAGIKFTTASVPIGFKKLNGGLNSTAGPLGLEPNEFSELQNIDFDKFGSFQKRNGYTALNTSAFNSSARWTGLAWFELASGTRYIVGTCGNKLAKMDSLDGTWDDITGALTVTAGNLTNFATFRDNLLGTNNADVPFLWTGTGDGSAMTVPTGLTTAKSVEVFSSYTFLANVTVSSVAYKSRVYWSALDSISSWDSADFNDVYRDDGQTIVAIKTLADRLVIFKERSIHMAFFTGDADVPFRFQKSNSVVGCIAQHSVQEVDNGLVFLASDGIYYFDGNNSFKISDRISETIQGYNSTQFDEVVSMYQHSKNRYWLAMPSASSSTNDKVIMWDSFNNALSIYDGLDPSAMVMVYNNGVDERPYWGDYAGFVYRGDTGTDDYPLNVQTAIDAYAWTRWIDFDDLCDQKGIPNIYVYYKITSGTLSLSYSYDFQGSAQYTLTFTMSTSSSLYGSAMYGTGTYAATGGAVKRQDLTGRGRTVRFRFSNNTLSETFRIDGFGTFAHLQTNV